MKLGKSLQIVPKIMKDNGGGYRDRTGDLLHAMQALSQTELIPPTSIIILLYCSHIVKSEN